VPDLPIDQIKGFDITRLGTRHCAEPTLQQTDPRGHEIYWVGPAGAEEDAGPGTDFYAINGGHVSITPLKVDLTDYKSFEAVSNWLQVMPEGLRFEKDN
jgi:5'-nucleotidase